MSVIILTLLNNCSSLPQSIYTFCQLLLVPVLEEKACGSKKVEKERSVIIITQLEMASLVASHKGHIASD